ncbi:STAS domain-containing protein [Microbispora sp. RL4-1S]|uniref:STAS domain-containing protein n=1 Tax=Microbispora oryzae TaxID=2806554 RepID=A0A941AIR7_9ACTN|nr:STAS domain-containing protein [Microbispora oryzae]MBP2705461.1 STAS domain-containing protein [Microbispora oryzae]
MSFRDADGPIRMTDSAIFFTVGPEPARADIPALCADLAALVRGRGGGVVICDVAEVARPGVVTVEALARLSLTARRHGWSLVVSGAGPDLRELVRLLGLTGVLLQVGRQSEQREETGGVEEVVHGPDSPG